MSSFSFNACSHTLWHATQNVTPFILVYLGPFLQNELPEFFSIAWNEFPIVDGPFELYPKVLNRIEIGAIGGPTKEAYALFF